MWKVNWVKLKWTYSQQVIVNKRYESAFWKKTFIFEIYDIKYVLCEIMHFKEIKFSLINIII